MSELPGLRTKYLGRQFLYFEELDSTNTYLKEHGPELPHGTAVVARYQTAAKGRLGRGWSERKDAGLALSCLLTGWSAEQMALLPLVTGLAVCKALESYCGLSPSIKWSNDVLLDGRKICGILCESRLVGPRGFAVVGVGVNLTQSQEELSRLGLVYAASLYSVTQKKWPSLPLGAEILNHLEPLAENCVKNGFAAIREEYVHRCVTLGREVRLIGSGDQEETGTALDVAEDGGLICEIGGKRRHVAAGEVSVRGLYGYS